MSDINALAKDILNQGINAVCRELPPFIRAINILHFEPSHNSSSYISNGVFYYSPDELLKMYKENKNNVTRLLLHTLLHCSLLHIFNTNFKSQKLWNLACDMCVEKIINDINIPCSHSDKAPNQKAVIEALSSKIKNFTAENIYYYLSTDSVSENDIKIYSALFCADNHKSWYDNALFGINTDEDEVEIEARSIYKREDNQAGDSKKGGNTLTQHSNESLENPEEAWREITKQIIRDTDFLSAARGINAGNGLEVLKAVTQEQYDYSDLLKRFIETNEALEINDDEFDYIYYTYGLKLYDNIPLVEPLEYVENSKIKKLIIAIDTSGSVKGPLVKSFIEKTYTILKTTDFFRKNPEIHLLQCDSVIQDIAILKTPEDLEAYINNLVLHGFGGTDFTPVFEYADKVYEDAQKKEFNGVIYFTDGDGIYPQKPPPYNNIFIIHDNGFDKTRFPVWATPLYIDINRLR